MDVEPAYTTIGLTVEARDALASFCKRRMGMNVREVASALVEWFTAQPDAVQTAILGREDKGMGTAYAEMLARLAGEVEKRAKEPKGNPAPLEAVGHGIFVEGDRIEQEATPKLGEEGKPPKSKPTRPPGGASRPK